MSYQESQMRMAEAEAALKEGDEESARALFREAARLQRAFIDALPADRVRTRSVYGLSSATLAYRAGDLDEAERLAAHLLSQPWLEPYSADRLRELLTRIWTDREGSPLPETTQPSSSARSAQVTSPGMKRRREARLPKMMGSGARIGGDFGSRP